MNFVEKIEGIIECNFLSNFVEKENAIGIVVKIEALIVPYYQVFNDTR